MDKNQTKSDFNIVVNRNVSGGTSPYRLVDIAGSEIKQVNQYLDSLAVRGLSEKTMRIYAFDLLNFWTWLNKEKIELKDLVRTSLLEYIRWQRQENSPSPTTINHRLIIVKCFYGYRFDKRIPISINSTKESVTYFTPRAGYRRIGWMHPIHRRQLSVKVKEIRRVIVPLTHQQTIDFLKSLKTLRDTAIVGFMLFCGLRSKEVINLKINDISVTEELFHILGKGNKERIIPLPANVVEAVDKYLKLERPKTESNCLFVVLKGSHRGNTLTSSGLYKIFRYHRKVSEIHSANPHRFRHTFAVSMIRAGISIPALMKLMGHSNVQTTMKYVNLFAEDIRNEFNNAVAKLQSRNILNESKTNF